MIHAKITEKLFWNNASRQKSFKSSETFENKTSQGRKKMLVDLGLESQPVMQFEFMIMKNISRIVNAAQCHS